MAFDPDAYLSSKPAGDTGFDPDAYLGQKPSRVPSASEVPTRENLAADKARPVLPDQPKGVGERVQEAAGNVFPLARSFSRKGTAELLGPAITGVTTAGGAALGLPAGPGGVALGGGLGYGIGEEIVRRIRGDQPTAPSQTVKDILTGATYEVGGRAAMPYIEKGIKYGARGVGRIRDLFDLSKQRAGRIARQAVGPENVAVARQALQSVAADDLTAAQALAQVDAGGQPVLNLPVAQALLKRAAERDPAFFTSLFNEQEVARLSQLEAVAGAADQTAARVAREEMQKILNQKLIPVLKTEMEAANIAGQMAPKLAAEAQGMREAAAGKVEDVRRFTAAAERARGAQEYPVPGMPRVSTQITYRGDLAQAADDVAEQAAAGSLRLGEGARFKDAALQSLEAHGLRPLTGGKVTSAINRRLSDPQVAPGNRDLQTALTRISDDINQWTNNNGVIDAWALDNIRKNSINSYINSLPIASDPKAARKLAAQITEQIRPILIDAVEEAGGTGYRQYLKNYSLGMQTIGQSKLGAEAMRLYAENPKGFIKLVEGNDPKKVEKIFGVGSYNIFKEMSRDAQTRFARVASELKRETAMDAQATAGEKALVDLMRDNLRLLRFPNFLNVYATGYNNAVAALEEKVGRKTLQMLTEAAKSAKGFDELLNVLPAADRNVFLRALQDPTTFQATRPVVGGVAAGMSQSTEPSSRTLAPSRMGGITDVNPRIGAR